MFSYKFKKMEQISSQISLIIRTKLSIIKSPISIINLPITKMQTKTIQFQSPSNLPTTKPLFQGNQKQCLKFQGCLCSVCLNRTHRKEQSFEPIQKQQNNLEEFIKQFPQTFPLTINAITTYTPEKGYHMHYYNGNKMDNVIFCLWKKQFLFRTKVSKLLSNHPLASNIQIYGSSFSKITAKHQVLGFLRKLQEKTVNSSKKYQQPTTTNSSQLMTKSLILPTNQQSLPSIRNPQQRQSHTSTILSHKYLTGKVLYIQTYTHEIPIKVYYQKDIFLKKLDNILIEYLDEEVDNFHPEKVYTINEEFWNWVYSEYGEEVFAYFVTEFYCRAYESFSKNKVLKGVFYWIFEKPKAEFGENTKVTQELGKHKQILQAQYFISKAKKLGFKVKVNNIKNITIEYHRTFKTFQQQYQQMILNRINTKSSDSFISTKPSAQKKNYLYQSRLDTFHSKVRDLFLKQQNKVLNQVQSQKQHQGVVDSNKLARLLLPNMGEYQTIREILNDEQAFQKLILFQEKKVVKERLRKAREKLLIEKRETSRGKQQQQFGESRFRNGFSPSKRIRVRTEY